MTPLRGKENVKKQFTYRRGHPTFKVLRRDHKEWGRRSNHGLFIFYDPKNNVQFVVIPYPYSLLSKRDVLFFMTKRSISLCLSSLSHSQTDSPWNVRLTTLE